MDKIILVAFLILVPTTAFGQSVCPPDHPQGRGRVEGYLTQANFREHRQSLGLDGLQPANVRVLTDATDLAMCQRLVSQFGAFGSHPNWYWSAFKVGPYYLVAWRWMNTDGWLRLGISPWLILDENLDQLGGFGS